MRASLEGCRRNACYLRRASALGARLHNWPPALESFGIAPPLAFSAPCVPIKVPNSSSPATAWVVVWQRCCTCSYVMNRSSLHTVRCVCVASYMVPLQYSHLSPLPQWSPQPLRCSTLANCIPPHAILHRQIRCHAILHRQIRCQRPHIFRIHRDMVRLAPLINHSPPAQIMMPSMA